MLSFDLIAVTFRQWRISEMGDANWRLVPCRFDVVALKWNSQCGIAQPPNERMVESIRRAQLSILKTVLSDGDLIAASTHHATSVGKSMQAVTTQLENDSDIRACRLSGDSAEHRPVGPPL